MGLEAVDGALLPFSGTLITLVGSELDTSGKAGGTLCTESVRVLGIGFEGGVGNSSLENNTSRSESDRWRVGEGCLYESLDGSLGVKVFSLSISRAVSSFFFCALDF